MKLSELGLKAKPQTKYFEGGYVSFRTTNHNLSYTITRVTKFKNETIYGGEIQNKEHLENILKVKSVSEAIQV